MKALVIAVIAMFFSLIIFNNIMDYETNEWCVQSVLKMDSIRTSNVMWRAIESPWIITCIYNFIILTEVIIALLCWSSVLLFLLKRDGNALGLIGLALGFVLFMFGFVVIAGEWFYMWQHSILAGMQQKAAIFSLVMLGCMLFVASPDHRQRQHLPKRGLNCTETVLNPYRKKIIYYDDSSDPIINE